MNLKVLNTIQKIAVFIIILSFTLLVFNLTQINYNELNMYKLALPLSNVLLIIAMLGLLFTQRSQK
jgi:hypothetical protein